MLVRTWPYGTTKGAKVLDVQHTPSGRIKVLVLEADDGEGHILVENAAQTPGVQAGDVGQIVFTKGGPTGGYWRFTQEAAHG